ncbi:MAG: 50S ribosomal protein L24 [bacterium]|nr:50S ribosomal protein L24 [bacterium]
MHLKTGDEVIVIAGNDKGQTGTVTSVDIKRNRCTVEGMNMRTKHKKPTEQNPQGQRIEEESSIHASNVMLLDPKTGKGTRKRSQEA